MAIRRRFDAVKRLDKALVLPNGSVRVEASLTQVGVFPYLDDEGNTVREYRPPEEVFSPASVASLRDAAVTVLHPPEMITPSNWNTYSAGHVSGMPAQDEKAINAELLLARQDAISGTLSKDLVECSCGYTVELDETPGVTTDGQTYDMIQRNIRYNHVAIGPAGWGRQGPGSAMRLDGNGNQRFETAKKDNMKIKIRVDGVEHEVEAGSAEHISLQARADAAKDAQIALLQGQVATQTGRADAAAGRVTDLEKQIVELPKRLAARVGIETRARSVLGADAKFDGADGKPLSDREVRLLAIAKVDTAFDAKDKSDEYIAAYFDMRCVATNVQDSMLSLHTAPASTGARTDSTEVDPDVAHAKMVNDMQKRGNGKLALSK